MIKSKYKKYLIKHNSLRYFKKFVLNKNICLKIMDRSNEIIEPFIGYNIKIHKGKFFSRKRIIKEYMVGFKFGAYGSTKKPITKFANKK